MACACFTRNCPKFLQCQGCSRSILSGMCPVRTVGDRSPYPRGISYEYQKKGLRKFAFCKGLIPRDLAFREQNGSSWGRARLKEKRDQGTALQTQLSTKVSIAQIRKLSRGIFTFCVQ